jgi:2-C-methyl-D-erythritol 4-phosphate cytidylyltransferase
VDGWHDVLRSYARQFGITKLDSIVNGGETSLKSIREGVNEIRKTCSEDDTIIVHDGNRPLITQDIISDVLASCRKYGSAVAAIPCTDEVMQIEEGKMESDTFLNRKVIYRIQTPDAYRAGLLISLMDNATEEQLTNLGATNTLMIDMGHRVHFSMGSELNIRLTTQEDIIHCESLLIMRGR